VAARVLGTGVLIDLSGERPAEADVVVELELFADVVLEHGPEHRRGPVHFAEIELDHDPTNQLLEAAHTARELNLGTIFGDLMIGGPTDLTRFELYAAPFRVELTDELRDRSGPLRPRPRSAPRRRAVRAGGPRPRRHPRGRGPRTSLSSHSRSRGSQQDPLSAAA
jgi:hypothetical protein